MKNPISNDEYILLLKQYDRLGWKIIPLDGKIPYWKGWDDPEKWKSGEHTNEEAINEIITSRFKLNVGIVTGRLSGILRIDVDQPKILGWNPEPAIKKGALAHTTSRGVALVIRSENPEVLAFSKKLVKKKEELDENLLFYEEDKEKKVVAIIEILGDGRQFVAPPSIHPEKKIQFKWITPLPDSPDKILTINSIEELYSLLLECCTNKDLIHELFQDYFKEQARKDTGEEGKEADELLEKWLEIILKHLNVAEDRGDYIAIHCPFHPPDNKPSFAIYRNTCLAIDFHDFKVYKLKELAEKLEIELPKGRRSRFEDVIRKYGLDKYGITTDDLEELSLTILDVEETKDGQIKVKGIKHGAFANWLRKKYHFATNSITEEIWMYHEDEGVWKPDGEAFIKKVCELIINALGYPEFATIRRIAEIVHHIKRYPQFHPDELNRAWREGWINCRNGVINIYTGEFKPHSPEFFFTWRINAEYNPEAEGNLIEQYLNTVSEDRELLEEIIAYCLIPGQPCKKFFILYGPTDSGKSTFIYLVEKFLGEDNCANVPLQHLEKNRFALSQLVGKLANLFADLPLTSLDACPNVKAITGGDTLFVEKKFQQGYFTKIDAKLIFSANALPIVEEETDAFWNRVVIVKFPYKFPKNEKFKEELTKPEELSALLNIVLKAIPRVFEKKFEGVDVERIVREWKIASDPLSVFIDECIEIYYTADDNYIDPDIYEFKSDIFNAFKRFCAKMGVESAYAVNYDQFCKEFVKRLRDRGIRLQEGRKERDGKKLRVWWGIKLKEDDTDDFDVQTPPSDGGGDDKNNSSTGGEDVNSFSLEEALGVGNPQEELLNEVLKEKESDEKDREENGEDKGDDKGDRDDLQKEEYQCVCGFVTSDSSEFDKHRATCEEFQTQQTREITKQNSTRTEDGEGNNDKLRKNIINLYNNLKRSVPPNLLKDTFSKALKKKGLSLSDVKSVILELVKEGTLPKDFEEIEETILVKAIDYIHIRINGREYKADAGQTLEIPLSDYRALDEELRGFLIPIDEDNDSETSDSNFTVEELEVSRGVKP